MQVCLRAPRGGLDQQRGAATFRAEKSEEATSPSLALSPSSAEGQPYHTVKRS